MKVSFLEIHTMIVLEIPNTFKIIQDFGYYYVTHYLKDRLVTSSISKKDYKLISMESLA